MKFNKKTGELIGKRTYWLEVLLEKDPEKQELLRQQAQHDDDLDRAFFEAAVKYFSDEMKRS